MTSKKLILIVEDDEQSRTMVRFLLQQWGYRVITAEDGNEAFEKILRHKPELVISDVVMPGMNGYELVKKIRKGVTEYFLPVILVSANVTDDSKVEGLNAGADGYLTKPYSYQELHARINVMFRIKDLTDELSQRNWELVNLNNRLQKSLAENHKLQIALERKNHELLRMSRLDGLTGLLNRRTLMEELEGSFHNAFNRHFELSIILFDIDNFKQINDTYGHLVGDHALLMVAEIIRKCFHHDDVIGRYGGEEFAVVLPDRELDEACFLAEKARTKIAEHTFELDEETFSLTISIGVARLEEEDRELKDLLAAADREMYRAKNKGKNQVCCRDNCK